MRYGVVIEKSPTILVLLVWLMSPAMGGAAHKMRIRLFERFQIRTLCMRAAQAPLLINNQTSASSACVQFTDDGFIWQDENYKALSIRAIRGNIMLTLPNHFSRQIGDSLRLEYVQGGAVVLALLSLDEYVAAVVAAELGEAPNAAVLAQAVVSRTYALKEKPRHMGYDFCDLTHCQVFKGQALAGTKSLLRTEPQMVLKDGHGNLAHVAYSSTCGGHTANAMDVWGDAAARYLVGVPCKHAGEFLCSHSPHFRWRAVVPLAHLASILHMSRPELHGDSMFYNYGAHGWLRSIRIGKKQYAADAFRLMLGRKLGWQKIKSARFKVSMQGGNVLFEGAGLGHGVGLCQYGAMRLAKLGYNYRQIIKHYFPRLHMRPIQED